MQQQSTPTNRPPHRSNHETNVATNRLTGAMLLGISMLLASVAPAAFGQPQIQVDPASLEATIPQGSNEALDLTIENLGDETLDWSLGTTDGGSTRGVDLVEYTDLQSFLDGSQGITAEDFSGGPTPEGEYVLCPGPFNSETDNECFSPGDLADGFSAENQAAKNNEIYVIGENAFDPPEVTITPVADDNAELVSFDPPVTAVAIEAYAYLPSSDVELILFDESGEELGSGNFSAEDTDPGFIGFTSSVPFGSISFNSVSESRILHGGLWFGESADAGGCSGAFPDWISGNPGTGSLVGSESIDVTVTLDTADLAIGDHETTLCIESNDSANPEVTVPVTLTVTEPAGEPDLVFDLAELDFGDVEVGTTSTPQVATLENTGGVDATDLTFSTPGSDFDADTSDCGTSLAAGASCELSITLTPAATGSASETLTVDSTEGASASLALTGNGIEGGGPGTVQGDTVLVSRASGADGPKGDNASGDFAKSPVSADGRYVVFSSLAANLHPDDADNIIDIFVRDLQTNETILVSRASGIDGPKGDDHSNHPAISPDGRYVAFTSRASNLVPDSGSDGADIFVRDLQTNETSLVSRADGSDGEIGNARSEHPSISADGRSIVFYSQAINLHPDATDDLLDIFVRDLQTDETILVSRATGVDGNKGNGHSPSSQIAANGQFVVFVSEATNLHPDDTDDLDDVFVRDLQTNETILVSRATGVDGAKADARSLQEVSISSDGRYVTFGSFASNLHPDDTDFTANVFLRDLQANETHLVSRAGGAGGDSGDRGSEGPAISADGRYVVFKSGATNLHPDDTDITLDVFLRDLQTSETILVSRASGADGVNANGRSDRPSISGDGRFVTFYSEATNLHPDDSDDTSDVYARDVLGQAGQADLTFVPPNLDFGDVEVGTTSAPQTVTLHNGGDAEATGVTFDAPGNGFDADTSDCGPLLDPQQTCEVMVTFTPPDFGFAEASLTVSSDQDAADTLDLTGNGVGSAEADLAFDPSSLDFGDVEVGEISAPQTATLQNTGTGAASDLAFSLPNAFTADTSACGTALDAGESCAVEVTFTPLVGGEVTAALQVDSTEGVSAALGLTGTGVVPPPAPPDLAFTPESLDFGEEPVGTTSAPQNATLENAGDGDATGLSFTTPGSGFDADTSDCGSTLSAGTSCSVSVTFTPGAPGGNAATLEVESEEGATATLGEPAPPEEYLYFFSRDMKSVFRMDPDNVHSGRSLFTSSHENSGVQINAFAVDVQNCAYYWSLSGEVRRANIGGTGEEILVSIPSGVKGLEIDSTSGTVYFSRNDVIYRADTGPTGITGIEPLVADANTSIRHSLALDIDGEHVYWVAWPLAGKGTSGIWRAQLDGSNVELLVDTADQQRVPSGIALDLEAGKVYWGEAETSDGEDGDLRIHRANLDGTGYEVFLVVEESAAFNQRIRDVAIDPDLGKVYWGRGQKKGLYRADLDGSNIERIPQVDQADVSGLTFLPGDIDAQCGRPEADICPEGVDCDRVETIYWHHGGSAGGELWRTRPDGSYREMIHEWAAPEAGQPIGLAVSRELGKVYWTKSPNEVYRANLDGTDVELLLELPFSNVGDYPRGIALDFATGKMYVAQQRRNGFTPPGPEGLIYTTLWKADLDGGNLEIRFILEHLEGTVLNVSMTGPRIDPEERIGYVVGPSGKPDYPDIGWSTIFRFDLDSNAPPEEVLPFLPPSAYPDEAWESSDPTDLLLDRRHEHLYLRQNFVCGDNCRAGHTYRMSPDGTNIELMPWMEDPNRRMLALDSNSERMYGTEILHWNHMSRWKIGDGEDLSLIHASSGPGGIVNSIALLPAGSGANWATLSLTGVGVGPELTVVPGSLDFGAVPVGGTGEVESVTLANTGNEILGVTGITSASSPFGRVGGNCPGTPFDVGPDESCTIDYIFQANEEGVFEQTITLDSSAGAQSFTLTGEGIPAPPAIAVAPSSIQANLATGQSTEESLIVSNAGGGSLDWAVTEDECVLPDWVGVDPMDGSVPSGEEQAVAVTLDAAGLSPGDFSTDLCLTSNDPDQAELVIPLSLTVTDQPGVLAVDPDSLDYGEVMEGFAAEQDFTVTNTAEAGAAPLEIATLEIGSGADVYAVTGGDCAVGTSLDPGASCTVQVTFTPDGEGAFTGQSSVATQDGQAVDVDLTGAGIPSPDEAFHSRFEDGGE